MSAFLRLVFAAVALSAPAYAPADAHEKGVPVNFHLRAGDLATQEGADAVYGRMMLRAKNKCDPRDEKRNDARDACAADLVRQWVEAVNDPRLDAARERAGPA
jgi:UrcA family protein